MNLKEYINRSLPNLNWNILPQIFEENEVELTEEIRAYLKETPKNTNWNVLKIIGESSDKFELPHKIYFLSGYENGFDTTRTSLKTEQDISNWVFEHEGQDIEFYSADGNGAKPMDFGSFSQKNNGYLWEAHDGSSEFVWVYSDSIFHSYDN